jgi:hypothetical protein
MISNAHTTPFVFVIKDDWTYTGWYYHDWYSEGEEDGDED